jgi:hypothetical protein
VEQIDGGGGEMKVLLVAMVILLGSVVVFACTIKKSTFDKIDAWVKNTRERIERGEFDD